MIALGLFLLAFVPMVLAVFMMRNCERCSKESWIMLGLVFLWGALVASVASVVIENTVASTPVNYVVLVLLVAPVVEELTKPLVLRFIKKELDEFEDGFIFGAVAGFGFAATENLLYGIRFWNEGIIVLFALFYIRTIGTAVLHASATALTGYGYSSLLLKKRTFLSVLPYFGIAIMIHVLFNFFTISTVMGNQLVGVVVAVVFALCLMLWIQKRIKVLDSKDKIISPT